MSVFINAWSLLSALPSLSQFGRGKLSLVAISFYALSLLFEPCCLSEFTLAGPQPSPFTRHPALLINNEHSLTLPQVGMVVLFYCSDFVINSYGELSCEKS